jgi:hypothetical protein
VRAARGDLADLFSTDWPDLATLQAALDQRTTEHHQTRQFPVSGTGIAVAHDT